MRFERCAFEAACMLFGAVLLALAGTTKQRATPVYDPATVVTVSGTVEEIQQHQCSLGWSNSPARSS